MLKQILNRDLYIPDNVRYLLRGDNYLVVIFK